MNDDWKAYYEYIREIPGQGTVALQPMLFTVGLFCHLQENFPHYRYRYCYESFPEALWALKKWDGTGHPPGNWLKRKGEGGDLRHPNHR